jgi:PEP-CTERM putative exosortase interaction domain
LAFVILDLYKERTLMRAFLSFALLLSAAAPAFAEVVPEPESLSLLAVAAVALLVARRRKK